MQLWPGLGLLSIYAALFETALSGLLMFSIVSYSQNWFCYKRVGQSIKRTGSRRFTQFWLRPVSPYGARGCSEGPSIYAAIYAVYAANTALVNEH
jgi:hypothetical protein